jgi:ATPases with chaperone activity, ATP-binding subunit
MQSVSSGDDHYEAMRDKVMDALRQHFRPEFLNRIDETVVFHALTAEELKHIVDIQLKILNKRLADRKITVKPSEESRQWLATTGYDPVFGARPLKRLIQREIENPLALQMLEGKFMDGDTILVNVDQDEDCLSFEKGERIEDDGEEKKEGEEKVPVEAGK